MLETKTFNFYPGEEPKVSIVIPVFNQEQIISKIFDSLCENLSLPTEVIVVVDKSKDKSKHRTLEYFKTMLDTNNHAVPYLLISAIVISSSRTLYETKSDNIGFQVASGEYVIELQSDMLVMDYGFDSKLVACLEQNLDLFAVSGRAITTLHTIRNSEFKRRANPISYASEQFRLKLKGRLDQGNLIKSTSHTDRVFPEEEIFRVSGLAGWRGGLIDDFSKNPELVSKEIKNLNIRPVYVGEVIMRGPVCFRNHDLRKLGFLNQNAFFLGYDEIDISLRAWKYLHKRVAFMPIYLFSPAEWGSTRKQKTLWARMGLFVRFVFHSYNFRKSLTFEMVSSEKIRNKTSAILTKEVRLASFAK